MQHWKAKRRRAALAAIVFLMAACPAVGAEGIGEGAARYDPIIDEELDRFEQGLAPATVPAMDATAEGDVELGTVTPSGETAVPLEEPGEALARKVVTLLHAEASSLVEELEGMKSPDGEVSFREEDRALILRDRPERLEAMTALIKRKDVLLETKVFPLEFIAAADLLAEVQPILTRDVGQVDLDVAANTLIVTDTPVAIARVADLVRKQDVFNAEVHVGAKVVEVVLNDEHLDGIDWEAIVSEYRELATGGSLPAGALSLGTVSAEDYTILLEALETVGAVRMAMQEEVRTRNGEACSVNGPLLPEATRNLQFIVTPVVEKEGPLKVGIEARPGGKDAVSVRLRDGETVVIGGLFREVLMPSTWKIPLLGDLPLLGFVFRNEGEKPRKAEVITFLTVTAVKKELSTVNRP